MDGEAAVLTEEIVRMTTLTGTAEEIATHLKAMEQSGLKNITVWPPPNHARELVVDIAEQLMPLFAEVPVTGTN